MPQAFSRDATAGTRCDLQISHISEAFPLNRAEEINWTQLHVKPHRKSTRVHRSFMLQSDYRHVALQQIWPLVRQLNKLAFLVAFLVFHFVELSLPRSKQLPAVPVVNTRVSKRSG